MEQRDIRCVCGRHPILARYGIDESGNPYLHIKVLKQRRIYHESIIRVGIVEIKCRDCRQWFTIRIKHNGSYKLTRQMRPEVIRDEHPGEPSLQTPDRGK